MITALTRLGILGMTVLLVAALTAGTDTQTPKAEATTAGAGVSANAIPPATATTAPADAPKTDANAAAATATGNLEPIPLELPKPCFIGTLENLPPGTHVKITEGPAKPRDPFLAPKGAKNVAFKRPVTASDMEPVFGTLDLITNGSKEAVGDAYVELGPGVQWVQVDLGSPLAIHALLLWHDHHQPMVYYDVIIQVSDDKDFITNVRTLFNNDHDNSAGMGIGEDWGYFETNEGLLLPAKGVKARYVRLYSNGNTGDDLNRYTEVEVYAVPAVPTKPASEKQAPGPATRQAAAVDSEKSTVLRSDPLKGEDGPKGQPLEPLSGVKVTNAPSAAAPTVSAANRNLVPLPISLPKPRLVGTPRNYPPAVMARVKYTCKPRSPFLAPAGCVNVARGRPVTASDKDPVIGCLKQVTDGDKEAAEDAYVELGPGVQWVQIDLGRSVPIYAILFWHDHRNTTIYHDVIVQVSDDKDFISGAQTLYNNDHDNSAGLGIGNHFEYFDTYEGKLVGLGTGGVRGRYVRLYSNGNASDDLNRYREVEVYGLPNSGTFDDIIRLLTPPRPGTALPIKLPRPGFD